MAKELSEKDKTVSKKMNNKMSEHTFRDDGSYFVQFPDGTETRSVPDLCAELNKLLGDRDEWKARAEDAESRCVGLLKQIDEITKERDDYRARLILRDFIASLPVPSDIRHFEEVQP